MFAIHSIEIKQPLASALTVVLVGLGLTACGNTDKTAGSASRSASIHTTGAPYNPLDADLDNDNGTGSHYDEDDYAVLDFGSAAGPADTRSITALLAHYYSAASAANGSSACRMIYWALAETIVEEYGHQPGSHGSTCATVMSKIFKRHHRELTEDAARLKVVRIRVGEDRAMILLRFGASERRSLAHREGATWKLNTLFDFRVP